MYKSGYGDIIISYVTYIYLHLSLETGKGKDEKRPQCFDMNKVAHMLLITHYEKNVSLSNLTLAVKLFFELICTAKVPKIMHVRKHEQHFCLSIFLRAR